MRSVLVEGVKRSNKRTSSRAFFSSDIEVLLVTKTRLAGCEIELQKICAETFSCSEGYESQRARVSTSASGPFAVLVQVRQLMSIISISTYEILVRQRRVVVR